MAQRLAEHVQSKNEAQGGLHSGCLQQLEARWRSNHFGLLRQSFLHGYRCHVHGGHGRSGHASGVHGVHRCFR